MTTRRTSSITLCALLGVLAAGAAAQEPAGPPPPSGVRGRKGGHELELLPDLGKIGAQVSMAGGASWNPYEVGRGLVGEGAVELPLARGAAGKLSYTMSVSLSQADSAPFTITDSAAYVANLAAGASRAAALNGPPLAPFPVRRSVRTRLRLLDVSPFALKYTVTRLDAARIRPYLVAGLDMVVVITRQDPVSDESLDFPGTAPFDDPLIGGLLAQAPELTARGYPTGQGNIEAGFHAGGGLEVRVSRGLSLNLAYRLTSVGTEHHLHRATSGLGFHW
jgi:opacity protein-like surface antigen